ncbi:PQQ-dependent sugar dehydrogenase [Pedosphaera parvula]|uniref:Heme-binding protein n=1 Tax=Pedosphaera parvula (strain Ellin514) TaxID=320771 RepID=B9XPK1_PEDPL|nr:PQQ-dependent sugar dehydrogenase [Pedosphaera parvula]EEF58229.1 heme-binding protein [Pedosphaera parvula Ellin514]
MSSDFPHPSSQLSHKGIFFPNWRSLSTHVFALLFLGQVTGHADPNAAPAKDKEEYRRFALDHHGNPQLGRKLFADTRVACTKCHTIDGSSSNVGPDLASVGNKFSRTELMQAVLEPSSTIAVGYTTTIVETKSGEEFQGVVREDGSAWMDLMGPEKKVSRIDKRDIQGQRTSNVSLMPEGLQSSMSLEEFTDLIDYLSSLKLVSQDMAASGAPSSIPAIKQPIGIIPFQSEQHKFDHPCWFGQVPGLKNGFLILEHKKGRIWLLEKNGTTETKTLFADLHEEIRPGEATGLLGLAFHPGFRHNRKYYLQHQIQENGRISSVVIERQADASFKKDSGQASRRLIKIPCSTDVHSGGGIEFGPDGFLYIGMGDTGPQGDPQGHAQDLGQLLGKMLRLDVDHCTGDKLYAIPRDNPFLKQEGAQPEIWAYGFREPWRFTFDSKTGDLWLGDVGQDRVEEVDLVHCGGNYGWNVYEGTQKFSTHYGKEGASYQQPVFCYQRNYGASVTGGYVYRGNRRSSFYGVYIFGDFNSHRIWGLTQEKGELKEIRQLGMSPQGIASFGRDAKGELFIVGYEGNIYKLDLEQGDFR